MSENNGVMLNEFTTQEKLRNVASDASPAPVSEILRFAQDDKRQNEPAGLARIASAFAAARVGGRAALMPYFTLGYPDIPTSEAVVRAVAAAGADLIELGVPFSDPLADGPTIQHSTQVALEQGMTLARGLALIGRLRAGGVTQPLLLMGYVNPILAYGVTRYVADAAAAGADGFIVPDLPPEEAGDLEAACRRTAWRWSSCWRPPPPRNVLPTVAKHTTGFVYLVSLAGVTGARDRLPPDLAAFAGRVARCDGLAAGGGLRHRHPRACVRRRRPGRRRDRWLGAYQGGGRCRRSRRGCGALCSRGPARGASLKSGRR